MRGDARRNRDAILDAAAALFEHDGATASLEQIARHAGVGSATLHRHFRGRQALLEVLFLDRVGRLCAAAAEIAGEQPVDRALWVWLHHVADHCASEKGFAELVRAECTGSAAPERSFALLARAGQPLLERARAAGGVHDGVTIEELLLIVNAISDVASASGADVDRLLGLSWDGVRPGVPGPGPRRARGPSAASAGRR